VPLREFVRALRAGRPAAPTRGRRRLLLALLALELLLLSGLSATVILRALDRNHEFAARETLLAEKDLPPGWAPVEAAAYPYMEGSPLLTVMLQDETVAGAFSAYRSPDDSSAVATYVVFRPDEPLVLRAGSDDASLQGVAPLVLELERLARQRMSGALPELFFADSDVPIPGSLRGRSVAPPTGEAVQSESILFATGPVTAMVVVEHPRGQEPFRPIEELAQLVYNRIQEQLD
jgi:hypothetical protein